MAQFEYTFQQDLEKKITTRPLETIGYTGDSRSILLRVKVTKGGEAVDLTGSTISGMAILPNGATAMLTGGIDEDDASVAYVTMTDSALCLQGRVSAFCKATRVIGTDSQGDPINEVTTLLAVSVSVSMSSTDTIYDPDDVIPSIAEIQAAAAAALEAAGEASQAAQDAEAVVSSSVRYDQVQSLTEAQQIQARANTGTDYIDYYKTGWAEHRGTAQHNLGIRKVAEPYTPGAAYAVGDYVIQDGDLYRCTTAIAQALDDFWEQDENWTYVAPTPEPASAAALTAEATARAAADDTLTEAVADVESIACGGFVKGKTLSQGHYISGGGSWLSSSNAYYACIPIKQNDVVTITAGRGACYYAFLAADYSGSSSVSFAAGETGRRTLNPGVTATHVAPSSSAYLYCLYELDPSNPGIYQPASVTVNYQEYAVPLRLEGYENMISCAVGEPALYRGYMITSNNVWYPGDYSHLLIPVKQGDAVTVLANETSGSHIAFLAEPCRGAGAVAFAYTVTSRVVLSAGQRASYTVPTSGNYLYVLNMAGTGDYRPADIIVNGVSVFRSAKRYIRGVFQYASGSYMSGQATERLIVAVPQGDHYTGFTMYHYEASSINCDVWRIQSFNTYDNSLTVLRELSTNGELECAVLLDGRSDFSGGSTHGDEVMTGWDVFLDGQRITGSLSSYTAVTPFEELRLVRQSNLYDPADSTTVIALHGCEYVYTLEGLAVNQSLEWMAAATLSACYMAMFTPKKTVTNRLYSDLDFTPITLESSNYSVTKAGARKAVIYDNSGSFWACFRAERYPTGLTGGDNLLITDNGGNGYNKLYYVLANGGTSNVGELWQTTTVYEIKA